MAQPALCSVAIVDQEAFKSFTHTSMSVIYFIVENVSPYYSSVCLVWSFT